MPTTATTPAKSRTNGRTKSPAPAAATQATPDGSRSQAKGRQARSAAVEPKPGTATDRKAKTRKARIADTADRHVLYQLSVQNVEAEIDFVDAEFKRLRGRRAVRLREDFCGTGNTSCEWVRRRPANIAVGLDIDQPTLDWGHEHNLGSLTPSQRKRVTLLNRDVMTPGDAVGFDVVLAMNFSYWLFKTRPALIAYFRAVRESLADGGVFFLDHYGGSDSMSEMVDTREIEKSEHFGPFVYEWDQDKFNPVTGEFLCHIHFKFPDRSRLDRAFTYSWRLWTMPEVRELLLEAGFSKVTVYWEGDELDEDGEPTGDGDGVFTPTETGEADPAFICYIGAEK
jgi:SAM-dependent methyltransferase